MKNQMYTIIIAVCVTFLFLPIVSAQEENAATATIAPVTVQEIETAIQRVNENTSLDETLKSQLSELYNQALESLKQEADWKAKSTQFEQSASAAQSLADEIQKVLSTAPAEATLTPEDKQSTAAELGATLTDAQTQLETAKKQVADLESEIATRDTRRKQLPELLSAARTRLTDVTTQLEAAPPEGEAPELSEARKMLNRAKKQGLDAEILSYEREKSNYDIRGKLNLLTLRRDRAMREAAYQERYVALLQEQVNKLRQEEATLAAQQAKEATQWVQNADPVVKQRFTDLAQQNQDLVASRTGPEGIIKKIEKAKANVNAIEAQLTTLQRDSARVRERVEKTGLNNAVGMMLRKQLSEIPDTRGSSKKIRELESQIAQAELNQIEYREQRSELSDIAHIVQTEMAGISARIPEGDREKATEQLRKLLETMQGNLDNLIAENSEYFSILVDTNIKEVELLELSREFITFINEHVLWIKSDQTINLSTLKNAWHSFAWFVDEEQWSGTIQGVLTSFKRSMGMHILMTLILAMLLGSRIVVNRKIRALGKQASVSSCTHYGITLEALVFTIFFSLSTASVIFFLSWVLAQASETGAFGQALSNALLQTGIVVFVLTLALQIIRPEGLGVAHFNWSLKPLISMRRHLRWLEVTLVAAVFMVTVMGEYEKTSSNESFGRIVFLASTILLGTFIHVVAFSNSGSLRTAIRESKMQHGKLLSRFIYLASIILVIALFFMVVTGYYYTAVQLSKRLFLSVGFFLGVLILRGLMLRWNLLRRRKLAMEKARERREAQKLQAEKGDVGDTGIVAEKGITLAAISAQTVRFINSATILVILLGLWFIWSEMIPALNILGKVQLWETGEIIDGEPGYITLSHIFFACFIGLLTVIFTKNTPGILEIAFLQRMGLGSGERYAVTTIAQYLLIATGAILAFNALGIGWAKVQWLVAALSVGLGFGLQEIFANFVSGIIILFEQPVRVGDTVTIGGVSGTVSRIRIRATTIVDWDRKELVVPNKEFVTGQLINWTLTDSVIRVIIPVGIAYGSDTAKAMELLKKVATDNPDILEEPAPQVYFLEFGDSTLNFELRVFVKNLDTYLPVKHALHLNIDNAFRAAGVEIAFPQQDIHVRSIKSVLEIDNHQNRTSDDMPTPQDIS